MNDNLIQIKKKVSPYNLNGFTSRLGSLAWLLVISLSFWSCGAEQAPSKAKNVAKSTETKASEPSSNKKKSILFYGDSLTAGYGLEEDQSFPSHIEDKIDSLALNYKVVNAGLSGETSSGGLKRIDWVMRQPVDIFILELGANDMLRGLPLDQTRNNLSQIITKVKTKYPQAKVGLCEMIAAPNMGSDYVKGFNKIFHDLAAEHSITLFPFFLEGIAGYEQYLLQDGKHPNAAGQVLAAENIWKVLEGML